MRSETLIACTAILLPLTLHPPPPGILPLRLWVLILPIPPPPSPTHPSPQYAAGPLFPYLFPASSLGFLRGCGPSHLPAWRHPPSAPPPPDSASAKWHSPSRGRQSAGRPGAGPSPAPVGFLPTFSGTFPACPLPRISPADPISPAHPSHPARPHPPLPSAPPHILPFPTPFPFSFISVPSPTTLSRSRLCPPSSVFPCSVPIIRTPHLHALYPSLRLPALPFSPKPFPSPSRPALSPSPRLCTPPLRRSGASPFSLASLCRPRVSIPRPSELRAPAVPSAHPALRHTPSPLSSPANVPSGWDPPLPRRPPSRWGARPPSPPLPSAHSEVPSAALACVPAPSLPPRAGPRPLPAAARRP